VTERPLHHIALGTPRVEAIADFYERCVGLERFKVHFESNGAVRSIWLRCGLTVVMVERTSTETRLEPMSLNNGWSTVVFGGDFGVTVEESICDAGGTRDGHTEFTRYFRDPDGNRFGLSSFRFEEIS